MVPLKTVLNFSKSKTALNCNQVFIGFETRLKFIKFELRSGKNTPKNDKNHSLKNTRKCFFIPRIFKILNLFFKQSNNMVYYQWLWLWSMNELFFGSVLVYVFWTPPPSYQFCTWPFLFFCKLVYIFRVRLGPLAFLGQALRLGKAQGPSAAARTG